MNEMSYLRDFKTRIQKNDYASFLSLWEEYCSSDEIDPEELILILKEVKNSSLSIPFGRQVEKGFILYDKVKDPDKAHQIFKLILDLETVNSSALADRAIDYLKSRYPDDKMFLEKLRLVGLRNRERFQGCISNFELLTHLKKGNFVFHLGGWGLGEIVDVSFLREQLSIEFDLVAGKRDLSFENAFKTLIPIPSEHFLARRYADADALEIMSKENSVELIHLLLRDLGPKNATEIKDELCDIIIPQADWSRWWQNTRNKLKKDPLIESPRDIKQPFEIRREEISHGQRLEKVLKEHQGDLNAFILQLYNLLRDFPEVVRKEDLAQKIEAQVLDIISNRGLSDAQELQMLFFLEDLRSKTDPSRVKNIIQSLVYWDRLMDEMTVLAFKKRLLVEIRKQRSDWLDIFLDLLRKVDFNPLRDYILSEILQNGQTSGLIERLERLLERPDGAPDLFLWYFGKVIADPKIPLGDNAGKNRCFESLLILLSRIENDNTKRDCQKKIQNLLSEDRYQLVRQIFQKATLDEVKEFLLLATKCHTLGGHDLKIFHSLAEVAHPALTKLRGKEESEEESGIIWTTSQGYAKLQDRIKQIATVETVENAKEIEVARAHGDLRENAEFKSALERRDRLQGELKFLSGQLQNARILTKDDIRADRVGIGAIISCENQKGQKTEYTLLGPFEADPDRNILSFQSKLAQTMKGLKLGQTFKFQGEEYKVLGIRSYL